MTVLRPSSYQAVLLRECNDSDDEALFRIFVESRDDLITATADWDEAQRETMMRIQFQARQNQYHSQFSIVHWDVIVMQGEIIGQLLVAPLGDEFRLLDLSLLPDFRNRGIGGALLDDLLHEAAGADKRVTLHVLQDNPAARLYRRLGFKPVGDAGIYRRMEWVPAAAASSANGKQSVS